MSGVKLNKFKKLVVRLIIMIIVLTVFPIDSYANNIWSILTEADSAQKAGNHQVAIAKYGQVVEQFIKSKDHINAALMYGRMGKSQSMISDFNNAEKSWRKESEMWGKLGKLQEQIAANRKADLVKNTTRVFTEVDPSVVGNKYYNGAKEEPIIGAYIGAYAELGIGSGATYFETFPALTGKDHAAYLLYMPYGNEFNSYGSHFAKAKAKGKAIQLALEPHKGLDFVKDDAYLRKFAKDASDSGVTIFLRFANEMNELSAPWHTTPEKYIEKFRIVSKVFKEEAPNIVMVWAPNDFPPNTIESYYPGDEYVDWVGVSSYGRYHPELDPLGQGIDRSRYIEKVDHIYNLYSDKKPIYIAEGAASYVSKNGEDMTKWAAQNLNDMYTYLPMLYPKIKGYFYFNNEVQKYEIGKNKYILEKNETVLEAYKKGVSNPYYLSDIKGKSPVAYEEIKEVGLDPIVQTLHSYIKTGNPDVGRVDYVVWGEVIGTSKVRPYTIKSDFSKYAGKNPDIIIKVYDSKGGLLSSETISTVVRTK